MLENVPLSSATQAKAAQHQWRRKTFDLLETADGSSQLSRVVDMALIILIIASVLAVVFESMESVAHKYADALYWFEISTIAVFSIEYALRIWSCVESKASAEQSNAAARIRFAFSFHAVVDLLAVLPFYLVSLGLVGGLDMRFLRAIRLLRVFKLARYSSALNMLIMTINENGRALSAAFLILITVMLLAASGMYYFERDVQPEDFGSIPAAMWWAFATMTTVGYGDVTPITAGGKIFGALITVIGIGMVALPTSILASGYSRQLQKNTALYNENADRAFDDGILTEDEQRDLEALRVDLGLDKNTASQILDSKMVAAALQQHSSYCPTCGAPVQTSSRSP